MTMVEQFIGNTAAVLPIDPPTGLGNTRVQLPPWSVRPDALHASAHTANGTVNFNVDTVRGARGFLVAFAFPQ